MQPAYMCSVTDRWECWYPKPEKKEEEGGYLGRHVEGVDYFRS